MAFITAGYPEPSETVDVMLSLEKGGADIIELGVPFTDPLADGPTIQESSQVCICIHSLPRDSIEKKLSYAVYLAPLGCSWT